MQNKTYIIYIISLQNLVCIINSSYFVVCMWLTYLVMPLFENKLIPFEFKP